MIRHFLDLDALVEHDGDLIAVAVPPTAHVDAIADYILTGKDKDYWGAQDGYIFEKLPPGIFASGQNCYSLY